MTRAGPFGETARMHIARYVAQRREPHAVIREDDTHGVLAADPVARPVEAPLPALEAAAREAPGREPGSAVVFPGRPARIHAVVHDLGEEPTWREQWLVAATLASLTAAHRRGLTVLATPLLGTVHGRAPMDTALDALARALDQAGDARPDTLLLEHAAAGIAAALARRLAPPPGG